MWPTLGNPPVTEAQIDLQVESASSPGEAEFERFAAKVAKALPSRQELQRWKVRVALPPKADHVAESSSTHRGWMLRSADGLHALQVRDDGIAYSRLRPYLGWQALRAEALAHWRNYCSEFAPLRVRRIAVRFINHIQLPPPPLDLERFFTTVPKVGDGVSPVLDGYFARLVFAAGSAGGRVILTTALEADPGGSGRWSMLFDIDAFNEGPLPIDEERVFAGLDQLRAVKNDVFFGSLTPVGLDLFR